MGWGVVEFDVDRGGRGVPSGVGERLLDDAVGGQLNTGVQVTDRSVDDEPDAGLLGGAGLFDQRDELAQPGLGPPVGGLRAGVGA